MANFNFFGRRIIFKVEQEKKDNISNTQGKKTRRRFWNILEVRIFLFIIIFIAFGIFSKINSDLKSYKLNDIVENDIIAPISVEFEDNVRRNNIIRNISLETKKIYRRDNSVNLKVLQNIDEYFARVNLLSPEIKEVDVERFINSTNIIIRTENMKKILEMSENERREFEEKLKYKVSLILEKGVKEEPNYVQNFMHLFEEAINPIEYDIMVEFLIPNEIYDEEATENLIKERISKVGKVFTTIKAGDVILEKGEKINDEALIKLKYAGLNKEDTFLLTFLGTLLYTLVISSVFFIAVKRYLAKYMMEGKYYNSTLITVIGILFLSTFFNLRYMITMPFASLVLILGIIAGELFALIVGASTLLFLFAFYGFNYMLLISNLISLIVGIYFIKRTKNRTDLINAGIAIGITKLIAVLAIGILQRYALITNVINMIQALASGILSGMITMAILPYLENTFNILTNIKLVELGDFSHPLLRDLLLKAPGTFHHSIQVATLSESAAEAIGANSTFTRVAAYYHDIGKTKRPNFFVENQLNGVNPHESLNPYLSTLVITSHTKDGVEMARRYKIPKEIRDIMKEHQGTTMLAYFYNKAKKENPDINEADFMYEGPKPRSKESAIIMLADSIEAAVRSMDEKNPVTVENTIRRIIQGKIDAGQLSEAELTFKDIEIVIKSFVKVVQGIYHSRIKYPDISKLKK